MKPDDSSYRGRILVIETTMWKHPSYFVLAAGDIVDAIIYDKHCAIGGGRIFYRLALGRTRWREITPLEELARASE